MNKERVKFIVLAVVALLIAGVVTYGLLNPKEVQGFYDYGFGGLPDAPTNVAVGEGTISFEKTEDDINDRQA